MAPSTTSPSQFKTVKREPRSAGNSREPTPTMTRPKMKDDAQLATSFKKDLTEIRTLVTCTICDQLLYEPYTLGCGHTYCYSCMCSWFTTNRRKKTCPECRARVTIIPAPNFLIKQMVEQVFTKRQELMPADETIQQHVTRRAEEIATVETDRNGLEGLFKGLFKTRQARLMVDEADGGIVRCPGCGHEHTGGPECIYCGLGIEGPYGFSDAEDDLGLDELDDVEIDFDEDDDLDSEIGAEFYLQHGPHFHHGHFGAPFLDVAARNPVPPHLAHLHHHRHHNRFHEHNPALLSGSEDLSSDIGDNDSESVDSDDSLNDFVVQDDAPSNRPANGGSPGLESNNAISLISDDESDEGGAISNRRPRHRARARMSPIDISSETPSEAADSLDGHQELEPTSAERFRSPSVLTVTDTDTNASEADGQAEFLRRNGWSPLEHGDDSDAEGPILPYGHQRRYGSLDTSDEDDSDDDSDTGTETAENAHTDEDARFRDSLSQTPVPLEDRYQSHIQAGTNFFHGHPYEHQEEDPDNESDMHSVTDYDGDTDMTPASPQSRDSRSVSANPYFNNRSLSRDFEDNFGDQTPRGERGMSINTTESSQSGSGYDGFNQYDDEEEERSRLAQRLRQLRNEASEQENARLQQQLNQLRNIHRPAQNLGPSNSLRQVEDESSDSSPRPAGRRSRRPQVAASVQQQFNPQLSNMFVEHRAATVRGSQENPISFEEWDEPKSEPSEQEVFLVEPAASRNSNSARSMTAYRHMSARRVDPLRSSRSPSSTRVISSSQRNNRLPRQYSRRG
ncbi:hypothetical protein VTL71DRAFT_3891 [Oculimacula yallundae]|uniref:RING-type domain-containing protein n=1 Tax=Oculimacula yallundae TaxID=86028 RepID=A0ABR4C4A3_9HELO